MTTKTLAFDIICPNLRTRNTLEFALNQNGKGRFVNSKGMPDLVIVDCETHETLAEFKRFRIRYPRCAAILLFNQMQDADDTGNLLTGNVGHLVRPFSVKDLMQTIDQLVENSYTPAHPMSFPPSGTAVTARGVPVAQDTKVVIDVAKPAPPPREKPFEVDLELPTSIEIDFTQDVRTIDLSARKDNVDAEIPDCPALNTALPFDQYLATDGAKSSDIDLGNPAALQGIQINASKKLLGRFMEMIASAAREPTALCLTLNGTTVIQYDPATKTVTGSGDYDDLPKIAQLELADDQVSIVRGPAPGSVSKFSCDLEAFLWKLALYTYAGLLPEGTNVNELLYLRYWPNLTRLEQIPNGMRIASLWCRQPVSLANLIGKLHIPQKQVFAFYVAASTIGLAGPATRQADSMLTPSLPSMGVRSHTIIQQLADKLVRKNRSTQ